MKTNHLTLLQTPGRVSSEYSHIQYVFILCRAVKSFQAGTTADSFLCLEPQHNALHLEFTQQTAV